MFHVCTIHNRMYNLQYEVVTASNYLPFFKLYTPSSGIVNWQSTPHAATPIQLVFRLKQLAYLLKISICSLGGSPINEIEVWTAHAENYSLATFEEAAKLTNVGGTDAPVSINKICRLVKLVIKEKKEGKSIGISTIKMAGDFSLANANSREIEVSRVDKLLLELGISGEADYEKDLEAMDIDEETKITIRDMSKLQNSFLEQQNYDQLESLRTDIKEIIKIGSKIMEVQRNFDWASAKENYKDMKVYSEELQRLKQKRDRFDKIYETSRFEKMIEYNTHSDEHDQIYAKLLKEDQEALRQHKQKTDDEMNYKRMLVHNQYHQIRSQNPPWWEKDAPNLDDIDMQRSIPKPAQENKPPKEKPPKKQKSPRIEEDKEKQKKKAVESKFANQESSKSDKYDFSNPYIFNEGDVDLEKYMSAELTSGAINPDNNILRKYEELQFLKILGSKVWLSIHSENWRKRQSAAQSVLDYIEAELPQKYRNGNTAKLFQALLEFAWLCCNDKVLTIYMLGLKILSTCLKPPICAGDVTAEILNKGIKQFVPVLIQKIQQSNSKAKEISQGTLLSIFKHPSADPAILHKQILRGLRQEVYNGKIVTADKLPARVVSARMEIALAMLTEIDVKAKNINMKQLFDLLAGPCLLHSNYEVRITAIELVGELYRYIGEPLLKMVVDLHQLRKGISEMVIARLKKIKQSFGEENVSV